MRFYPRYDTEAYAIDEALSILRTAVQDLVGGRIAAEPAPAPKIRVGTLAIPLETVEILDLTPASFDGAKLQLLEVEQARYGDAAQYPPDVLRSGGRPLLQYPLETLETTAANPRAIGAALRDRVSGRVVGYALGSALENHDEEGVASDPHFGENNTFYLQALATLPTVQNAVELENLVLDAMRDRARGGLRVSLDADRGALPRVGARVAARSGRAAAGRQLPAQRPGVRVPAGGVDAADADGRALNGTGRRLRCQKAAVPQPFPATFNLP